MGRLSPRGGRSAAQACRSRRAQGAGPFLRDWEYWCSELLESHISYPAIAFFRSQHQRQSWVAALAAILDVSALVVVGIDGVPTWQAHVTFAIARHAAVDLLQVIHASPDASADRLPSDDLEQLRRQLENAGLRPDQISRSRRPAARDAPLVRTVRRWPWRLSYDAGTGLVAAGERERQLADESAQQDPASVARVAWRQ